MSSDDKALISDGQSSSAITPDVLPPERDSRKVPTTDDLPPSPDFSWKDGKEVLVEALGRFSPELQKYASIKLEIGDYSQESRLQVLQWKWLLEQTVEIRDKLDELLTKLSDEEKPEPADIAAIVQAVTEASEKTADYKKRRLLKNALVNAFDIEQYKNGMTLRLISILKKLEYGDVAMLGNIYKADKMLEKCSVSSLTERLDIKQTRMVNEQEELITEATIKTFVKARLIFGRKKLSVLSKKIHHLEVLRDCNLVILGLSSKDEIHELAHNWNLLIWQNEHGRTKRPPQITELGHEFIRLVLSEDELNSDDVDAE